MIDIEVYRIDKSLPMPAYQTNGALAFDLYARIVSREIYVYPDCNVVIPLNLIIKLSDGYGLFLFPRSSLFKKKGIIVTNSVGVIDSGYRGEVVFKFKRTHDIDDFGPSEYYIGDRIGQIVILPYPQVNFIEVDDLSNSDRGIGGFGSTDPITAAIESNCNIEEDAELNKICDKRLATQKRISVNIEDL